jgi:ASC-1-like (ASCH) protein
VFINREHPDQTISAKVTGLLRYNTFHELFSDNDPAKFGGESVDWLVDQINEFYTEAQQQAHGVVGIEFTLLKS